MLALISFVIGVFCSIFPYIIQVLGQHKLQQSHLNVIKVHYNAMAAGLDIKALKDVIPVPMEQVDTNNIFQTIKTSISPIVTYMFFFLFVIVKLVGAYILIKHGNDIPTVVYFIWDTSSIVIFAVVLGFFFGTYAIEKYNKIYAINNVNPL